MAGLNTPTPKASMSDGESIPMLAFGTGTTHFKKSGFGSVDRNTVDAVKWAIKAGFVHIDTAEHYNNEEEVGIAIKECKVDRKEIYVTTKVWDGLADIPGAIDASLRKLQLQCVDLPKPIETEADLKKAWTAMEAVKASGKAKSIGVSNFTPKHLEIVMSIATSPPVINQVPFHLYQQQSVLREYQDQKSILTMAYSPLAAATQREPGPVDAFLDELARKYYVSKNEICLRWCLDVGVVAVTTSKQESRIGDYMRSMTFSLTPRERDELASLGQKASSGPS